MEACHGTIEVWSPYTAILADCFFKAQDIGSVKFSHCRRDANRAAHNLARIFYDSKVEVDWDGDPPSFILSDLLDSRLINKMRPRASLSKKKKTTLHHTTSKAYSFWWTI